MTSRRECLTAAVVGCPYTARIAGSTATLPVVVCSRLGMRELRRRGGDEQLPSVRGGVGDNPLRQPLDTAPPVARSVYGSGRPS